MNYYLTALKKYAVFTGRARRTEYWMFVLFYLIGAVVVAVIGTVVGAQSALSTLYKLAFLIPAISAGVRRMHDTNHSGWWLLFPIVNLIFAVTEGDKGENRFGPDPKAPDTQAPAAIPPA
jgi:uncharacterized membrane protein YhaH (DUF805 family)